MTMSYPLPTRLDLLNMASLAGFRSRQGAIPIVVGNPDHA
jgi:hypothetical protein